MISDRLKQRLVGAAVLIALAVIFVPVLFDLQPSRQLDQTSQIPPAPAIKPVEIAEPVVPAVDNDVPAAEELFELVENEPMETPPTAIEGKKEPATVPAEQKKAAPATRSPPVSTAPLAKTELPKPTAQQIRKAPEPQPRLLESGLPEAWVIQIVSYREQATAAKQVARLQQAGFKAYQLQTKSGGIPVFRVIAGPYISRQTAEQDKKRIDATMRVNALIMSFEP